MLAKYESGVGRSTSQMWGEVRVFVGRSTSGLLFLWITSRLWGEVRVRRTAIPWSKKLVSFVVNLKKSTITMTWNAFYSCSRKSNCGAKYESASSWSATRLWGEVRVFADLIANLWVEVRIFAARKTHWSISLWITRLLWGEVRV